MNTLHTHTYTHTHMYTQTHTHMYERVLHTRMCLCLEGVDKVAVCGKGIAKYISRLLCFAVHKGLCHCNSNNNVMIHCTTLHCTTLHYTTLHYTTLHCTALHGRQAENFMDCMRLRLATAATPLIMD